ncbi:hypothetical protein [Acaryochloris sp. CCMEE 5410]|uniref:hypothetical protein n=1 Tax=Acaryochloris sp. CCMEE 5410 TaxID=310037 RepID=UPI0021D34CD2|nr:hypothetical protein [Acaryochloris sp. CCMEE 5410]
METELAAVKAEQKRLTAALQAAEAAPIPLQTALQAAQTEKASLEQQLAALTEQNQTLQDSLEQASDTAALETELAAAKAECDRITQANRRQKPPSKP